MDGSLAWENDFRNWSSVCCLAIEEGDYSSFLEDASFLIVCVVSDNSLPSPIGSYTSVFLEHTIPYMTATILSLSIANPADYDTVLPFLDSVLMLGIWAVTNDKAPLFHLLPSVLNSGNNFYKPRPPLTGDVHERVLNSFLENRYFDTMLERLREPGQIAAFGIFYNVLVLVPMDSRYDPLHGVFLEAARPSTARGDGDTDAAKCGPPTCSGGGFVFRLFVSH
jgi:hypothetical protein